MVTLEQALAVIKSNVHPTGVERIPLADATGRVLSEPIRVTGPAPPHPVVLVSGYALRLGESESLHEFVISSSPDFNFAGSCVPVSAGDSLPEGADTVVATHDAVPRGDRIVLSRIPSRGMNVAMPGQMKQDGDVVYEAGRVIGPVDLALLAELGLQRVDVYKRPRVAVMAVGDALSRIDEAPAPGHHYDSSSAALCAMVNSCGGEAVPLGPFRESAADIEFAMGKGLEDDCLIISARVDCCRDEGPSQVLVKKAATELFSGLAATPGGDTIFSVADEKPILLVSRTHSDILVTSELLIVPLLHWLAGTSPVKKATLRATLSGSMEHLDCEQQSVWAVEVIEDGQLHLARQVAGWPGAAMYNAASIDGLCLSEPGGSLHEGDQVEVYPLRRRLR